MQPLKNNVAAFDKDVLANQGYRYTTNASYSARVANQRLTDITVQILNSLKPKSIIDVGCGDGVYTSEIKQEFSSLEVSGFDPAAQAIALASKLYPEITFFVDNVLNEDFAPGKHYDTAILRGVLHHLDQPELALTNTAAIADALLIIEPNGNNPILKLIEKRSQYHIEHEEKSYSIRELKLFCKQAHCSLERVYYVGFVPFFFPTWPAKLLHFLQPLLERTPLINRFFSAQIVLVVSSEKNIRG